MNKRIRFDFRFHAASLIAITTAVVSILLGSSLPVECGYENGCIENLQMAVLALGVYFCFRARNQRSFFVFLAMVLVVLMLREVNCGRTLFFAKPGGENLFYKWDEIPYGWVARVLFGIYLSGIAVYFFRKRLYAQIRELSVAVPVPVWNVLLMGLGIILGNFAERVMKNMIVEELAELVFYIALVGGIHIYARFRGKPAVQ